MDRNGGFGVCSTRILLGRDVLAMCLHLHRVLGLRGGRCFGLLLRERSRMSNEKPELCLTTMAIRILHVDATEDTSASPAAGCLVLGTAGFFE
jgi:hypothetical protein